MGSQGVIKYIKMSKKVFKLQIIIYISRSYVNYNVYIRIMIYSDDHCTWRTSFFSLTLLKKVQDTITTGKCYQ